MTGMRRTLVWLGLSAVLAPGVHAADLASVLPGYVLGGAVTAGYRFVDVDGSRGKYREDINIHDGPRLFELLANADATDAATSRLDRIHLEVMTPGPEPVQQYRLSLLDRQLWDFRVRFTRSKYFYAVPQLWEGAVADVVPTEDLHDWNFVRTRGSVDFTLHPKGLPTVFAGYQLYQRDGTSVSTVLAPVGETFQIGAPVNDITHVGRIGTEFTLVGTNILVQQEYRHVARTRDLGPVQNPVGVDPGNGDDLDVFTRTGDEHLDIPATTLRWRRPIGDRVEVDGGYYYSHAELRGSDQVVERGTSPDPAAWPPLDSRQNFNGSLDTNVADAGVVVGLAEDLRFDGEYRFDGRSAAGRFGETGTLGPVVAHTSDRLQVQRVTGLLAWDPRPTLALHAGLRYAHQTTHFTANDIDQTTDTLGPVAGARYRPWTFLDLSLRYEYTHIDDPIRVPGDPDNVPPLPDREITLTTRNRTTFGLGLRPWEPLSIRYQLIAEARHNDQFNAHADSVANSITTTLTPTPALSLFASYSRRDLSSRADVLFAPLYTTTTSVQQGTEDILQASARYDLTLWTQPWTVGGNVAWVRSDNALRPRLEAGGPDGVTQYDLSRVDAGVLLAWRHPWIEPGIETRVVHYNQSPLSENDYRAVIVSLKLTKRFGTP